MTLRKGLFQEKKYGLDIITMTNQKFFFEFKINSVEGKFKRSENFFKGFQ